MKRFEVGLLIAFLMLLIAAFNCSCSNVKKSQSSNSESVSVTKSDSSSVKTYTVIDTTKTDESTTVTEYEIEVDSMYTFTYDSTTGNTWIEHGKGLEETTGSWSTPLGKGPWPKSNPFFAKKVKIKAKITETKKAEQKGQTIAKSDVQVNTKSDSTKTVQSTSKQVTREPSAKIWIWFFLIVAAIVVIWWKRDWLIGKAVKLFT
jgi:cobalamin biosynthesis Mg chelatase CobN